MDKIKKKKNKYGKIKDYIVNKKTLNISEHYYHPGSERIQHNNNSKTFQMYSTHTAHPCFEITQCIVIFHIEFSVFPNDSKTRLHNIMMKSSISYPDFLGLW